MEVRGLSTRVGDNCDDIMCFFLNLILGFAITLYFFFDF